MKIINNLKSFRLNDLSYHNIWTRPLYVYVMGVIGGIVGLFGAIHAAEVTTVGWFFVVAFWLLTIFSCDMLGRKIK